MQRITIAPQQLQAGKIALTQSQHHYLVRVLRLRDGDRFIAMDGMGKWWLSELQGKQAQVIEPLVVKTELSVSVTLLVALPKGNAFDEVVRSCTELGVTCIVPVISDRTLLNPSGQKLERWRRIATEAAEQSERAIVPTVLEPISFDTALSSFATFDKYICEGRGNYPHLVSYLQYKEQKNIAIAIGCEGGWTESELEKAILADFQPVSLGSRILRAVTAPIVALSLIAAACEV